MKKLLSLIKATMTDEMQLFKIKKSNKKNNILIPVFLYCLIMFYVLMTANGLLDELIPIHQEKAALTIFILLTFLLITIEGIYKSGSLLFNCKDDNLLLSIPIKKSTVLFIRVLKFYVFELLFSIAILAPSMAMYAYRVNVGFLYYLISIITILLSPIIPIVISCLIGGFISAISTRFKHKNIVQIIFSMLALLICMYISFTASNNTENFVDKLLLINNITIKYYYTAFSYIDLLNNFNIINLILFLIIHLGIFAIFLISMSKFYYIINSKIKERYSNNYVKHIKTNQIKTNSVLMSLIKKELKTFINTPVLVVNAIFGLVLFIIAIIFICLKYNSIVTSLINSDNGFDTSTLSMYIPVSLYVLICFSSLTSTITSSLISLEGKKINILKSIPVKPSIIIISKVLSTLIIMIPIILIGDIIMFIRFNFNIFEILLCLIASVILPLVTESLGIIINLKYPKMDASNDAEVVKQSISSSVAVIIGMVLCLITSGFIVALILLFNTLNFGPIGIDLAILLSLLIYIIICGLLLLYIKKKGTIKFNNINV